MLMRDASGEQTSRAIGRTPGRAARRIARTASGTRRARRAPGTRRRGRGSGAPRAAAGTRRDRRAGRTRSTRRRTTPAPTRTSPPQRARQRPGRRRPARGSEVDEHQDEAKREIGTKQPRASRGEALQREPRRAAKAVEGERLPLDRSGLLAGGEQDVDRAAFDQEHEDRSAEEHDAERG